MTNYEPPSGDLRRRRVLVVEDNLLLADSLCDLLSEIGCEVVGPVARVSEALNLCKTGPVDCALLDVHLGRETSFAIADWLTQHATPFVFVTGSSDSHSIPAHLAHVRVMPKPFGGRDLVAVCVACFGLPIDKDL
jgi:DNA-binding response OmpR family regulator